MTSETIKSGLVKTITSRSIPFDHIRFVGVKKEGNKVAKITKIVVSLEKVEQSNITPVKMVIENYCAANSIDYEEILFGL